MTPPKHLGMGFSPKGKSIVYRSNRESIPKSINYEKLIVSTIRKLYDNAESPIKGVLVITDQSLDLSFSSHPTIQDVGVIHVFDPRQKSLIDIMKQFQGDWAVVCCGYSSIRNNFLFEHVVDVFRQFHPKVEDQYVEKVLGDYNKQSHSGYKKYSFLNENFVFEERSGKFSFLPEYHLVLKNSIRHLSRKKSKSSQNREHIRLLDGWGVFGGVVAVGVEKKLPHRLHTKRFDMQAYQNHCEFFEILMGYINDWLYEITDTKVELVLVNSPDVSVIAALEYQLKHSDDPKLRDLRFKRNEMLLGWNPMVNLLDHLFFEKEASLVINLDSLQVQAVFCEVTKGL